MSHDYEVLRLLHTIHNNYLDVEVEYCDSRNIGDVRIFCADRGFVYSKLLMAIFQNSGGSVFLSSLEDSDLLLFPDIKVEDLKRQLDSFFQLPDTEASSLSKEESEECVIEQNLPVSIITTESSEEIKEKEVSECFKCNICFKMYGSEKKLYYHFYNVHHKESSNKTKYKCPYCSKLFATQSDVTKHRTVHVDNADYKCSSPGCEKKFKRRADLNFHYKHHHDREKKKYLNICHCGKEFYSSSNLRRHISKFHS